MVISTISRGTGESRVRTAPRLWRSRRNSTSAWPRSLTSSTRWRRGAWRTASSLSCWPFWATEPPSLSRDADVSRGERPRQFGRYEPFSSKELEQALEGLWSTLEVPEGSVLFREGDDVDALYLVVEGEVL